MEATFRPDGDRPQFIELIERITRPWPVCLAD